MSALPPFVNEPLVELRRAPQRAALIDALAALDASLPLRVPVWIGTDRRDGEDFTSTDPGAPSRVIATVASATPAEVERAVDAAREGFQAWSARPAADRAAVLLRTADVLRERRTALTALAVRECAKPWDQADGDVCEAIDFLEYYARAAIDLEELAPALLQIAGERNTMAYRPRGVCAVIAPWNFPLAIALGMTAAALATGNAVVLKPAEQSPGCAFELVRALRDGGVPPQALALLPGDGAVGAALARHPRRADDRLHRLRAGRARHPRRRSGRSERRRAAPPARDRRARRQELRDRRQRRRPRRRRARHHRLRLRLRRAEVLRGLTRARPRGGRGHARAAPRRRRRRPRDRAGRHVRDDRPAGDRGERARPRAALRRARLPNRARRDDAARTTSPKPAGSARPPW